MNDDDPDSFERMLRFFYTPGDKLGPICELSGGTKMAPSAVDIQEYLLDPLELYALADKYDAPVLCANVTRTLSRNLLKAWLNGAQLSSIIRKHYETCITVGNPMSVCITGYIISRYMSWFATNEEASVLLREYPTFSVDMILSLRQKNKIVLPVPA